MLPNIPNNKNILVVDNEPNISNLIKIHLMDNGYYVNTAESENELFERIIYEKPNLITMDMMHEQKSGLKIMKKLRQNPKTKDIPIIVITIADNEEDCLEYGAQAFIQKPFDSNELIRNVNIATSYYGGPLVNHQNQ